MEIWWRRAAISACRAVWVRNVEAKSVNSAMKTGLILTVDDLINWFNSSAFSSDEVFGNHNHDVVYNHLGPEGNYLGQYGYYFTDRYHTPWLAIDVETWALAPDAFWGTTAT